MSPRFFRYVVAILACFCFLNLAFAQNPPPSAPPPNGPPPNGPQAGAPPGQLASPQQLDDLVAPIALYPDPLLAEILAASTYPMEIAEAQQWVQDHPKWKPSKLMDEAKKQKWDPSVQGLVAFPDVLARLTQDMTWTTQLGNAFLAQQADVMKAVQRMREQAQAKGKLQSTPQATVGTQNQNGQQVITIQPANPEVWYVPNYNPVYIWGPPVWGYYPPLFYPGIGLGFGWFPGIDIGLYFGGWGGWGWGGWGWYPNWFGGGIYLNHSFFHRYGFEHFHGSPLGTSAWEHNPAHRLGVPYANREVANRFGGSTDRFRAGEREPGFGRGEERVGGGGEERAGRGEAAPEQHFGSRGFEQRSWTGSHSVFGGYHNGGSTRMQSDHGFSSLGAGRTFGGGGFHGGGFGGGGFHGGGGGRR
jgi:Protein of unknown function (DUF3300)